MTETITLKAKTDHIQQLVELLQLFTAKRGSDAGHNNKAVPRTTYGDVVVLAKWWDNEFKRALLRLGLAGSNDKSKASRKEWMNTKKLIDEQAEDADPNALYPDNQWFWQQATKRLAIYLESLKVVPTDTELMLEAIGETLAEHAQAAKDLAKDAADAAGSPLAWLKTAAYIAGGVAGAALLLPPIIRAFRD